ncbi:haloacid dehalogenase [Streptomyces sp. TG1A-8]|uniref:HAD family hydrolase n=1 Tax=Streptomyces sp. TG1A-8 TaxID=3051385 RepID=UPI00265C88FC|nr:haloacid dehalogenase [Streptomyces sp. TG1A-8]MDO0924364.1 haloacid dehalogenase [Streptomyces sp. TG1A-8]
MLPIDHVGVVFFCVDGVLVRRADLSLLLEYRLGLRSGPGAVTGAADGCIDAGRWAGIPESAVRAELDGIDPVPGVEETALWCHRSGLLPVIATSAWAPVGAYLADRFGFHSYTGRALEADTGVFTGRGAGPMDPACLRDAAVRRADDLGVAPQDCAAVGALPGAGPLLETVGLGVAFNAPPDLRARADMSVADEDLRAVIPALERLCPPR